MESLTLSNSPAATNSSLYWRSPNANMVMVNSMGSPYLILSQHRSNLPLNPPTQKHNKIKHCVKNVDRSTYNIQGRNLYLEKLVNEMEPTGFTIHLRHINITIKEYLYQKDINIKGRDIEILPHWVYSRPFPFEFLLIFV